MIILESQRLFIFLYFCDMKIEIDLGAGPCFGVKRATEIAEKILLEEGKVLCMGDLIHNEQEINRLERLGMKTIKLSDIPSVTGNKVLFRAHGEPPQSYVVVKKNKKEIIDASCPIVLNLQKLIASVYEKTKNTATQIVIYGDKNHAEVRSLQGNCKHQAIIISHFDDLKKIDFYKSIHLFSQTTKYRSDYHLIRRKIEEILKEQKINLNTHLFFHDSSCKIVAERDQQLKEFISTQDVLVFVSGSKSSNGRQLFQICSNSSTPSYFVTKPDEIEKYWFKDKENIGISGATSTPYWLLEKSKQTISQLLSLGQ
jgi:(E)-4-hydroxy-3-methyl-but-2-enyl pyrophosphate reductase